MKDTNPTAAMHQRSLIIPTHIAVIMDGNGRWAKQRGKDRTEGHVAGVDAVRRTIQSASDLGVKYLTLYTFSSENWNRPAYEVQALLELIVVALAAETPGMIENNVRLQVIGDLSRLPKPSLEVLKRSIDDTKHCTGTVVVLALSYSSRWELTQAMHDIALKVSEGILRPDQITPQTVSEHLATSIMPDPDLLIRTGGDHRISNFLLWQLAYSELYFTDIYWPDFSHEHLVKAIESYNGRERRYGLTSEQIQTAK